MKTAVVLALALSALAVPQETRLRDEKNAARLARLERECAAAKGWEVSELEHYFVVTNVGSAGMEKELAKRVEGVRAAFELVLDPPPASGTRQPRPFNPLDPPNKTVLRIHATAASYFAAVGEVGTNGLYFPDATEIVIHSAKDHAGRAEVFRMAQSLVVAEQLNRQFAPGEHAPWIEHGLQDYFAGFEFKNGKLVRKPHAQRLEAIRAVLNGNKALPLADLVRMNRSEYYGTNAYSQEGKDVWAQGWSFMWFLLHGENELLKGEDVIARYLSAWKEKQKALDATEAAFENLDWDVIEPDWRACILALKS